jgi:hypothetical protein
MLAAKHRLDPRPHRRADVVRRRLPRGERLAFACAAVNPALEPACGEFLLGFLLAPIFDRLVRQLLQRLQNQQLENQHLIPRLAARRIDRHQRIAVSGQARVAVLEVEKSRLAHPEIPRSHVNRVKP